MAIPAEVYAFGWQYTLLLPSLILVLMVTNYISLPVFYSNNIENCYMVGFTIFVVCLFLTRFVFISIESVLGYAFWKSNTKD